MKYMGSKLSLLRNGLGETVTAEAAASKRFVDLFTGTGRVAWHVAEAVDVPVLAADLQTFAAVLSGAVINRTEPLDPDELVRCWIRPSLRSRSRTKTHQISTDYDMLRASDVLAARELCRDVAGGPIWTAYGGHYFSPRQASTFDALLRRLPERSPVSEFCRALLVLAASRCAAAPGHTAQPFQPTETALPYIAASWKRDPAQIVVDAMLELAPRFARTKGRSLVADANELAQDLGEGDVVFVDPPYSSVHYSRFYHVLETIAAGGSGEVSGVGRYPPTDERPSSAYSIKTQARTAMLDLLKRLSGNGCVVILTFPQGDASNGLNGEELVVLARELFRVDARVVASRFSTLGGNGTNRSARRRSGELVVTMRPL